jgi:hypothetical protein
MTNCAMLVLYLAVRSRVADTIAEDPYPRYDTILETEGTTVVRPIMLLRGKVMSVDLQYTT